MENERENNNTLLENIKMRHLANPVASDFHGGGNRRSNIQQDYSRPFTVAGGDEYHQLGGGLDFFGGRQREQQPHEGSVALKSCPLCNKRFPDYETLRNHADGCTGVQ